MVERETISLMARTEEEFAIVKWFHNDKELVVERKRNQRLKLNTSGTLHLFCLEKSTMADAGTYTARTNADQTSCEVFIEGLFHVFTILQTYHLFRVPIPLPMEITATN